MRGKIQRSDVTEKCMPGTKQRRKQKRRSRTEAERQTLICHPGKEDASPSQRKKPPPSPEVRRRSYTTRACRFGVDNHMSWALASEHPTATMFSTPPGLCSEHTHEDDGDLSAHPHVPATAARHIARAFLAPRHRCSDAGSH